MGRERGKSEGNKRSIFERYARFGQDTSQRQQAQSLNPEANTTRANDISRNSPVTHHATNGMTATISPEVARQLETLSQTAKNELRQAGQTLKQSMQSRPAQADASRETVASRAREQHQSVFQRYAAQPPKDQSRQQAQGRELDKDRGNR